MALYVTAYINNLRGTWRIQILASGGRRNEYHLLPDAMVYLSVVTLEKMDFTLEEKSLIMDVILSVSA